MNQIRTKIELFFNTNIPQVAKKSARALRDLGKSAKQTGRDMNQTVNSTGKLGKNFKTATKTAKSLVAQMGLLAVAGLSLSKVADTIKAEEALRGIANQQGLNQGRKQGSGRFDEGQLQQIIRHYAEENRFSMEQGTGAYGRLVSKLGDKKTGNGNFYTEELYPSVMGFARASGAKPEEVANALGVQINNGMTDINANLQVLSMLIEQGNMASASLPEFLGSYGKLVAAGSIKGLEQDPVDTVRGSTALLLAINNGVGGIEEATTLITNLGNRVVDKEIAKDLQKIGVNPYAEDGSSARPLNDIALDIVDSSAIKGNPLIIGQIFKDETKKLFKPLLTEGGRQNLIDYGNVQPDFAENERDRQERLDTTGSFMRGINNRASSVTETLFNLFGDSDKFVGSLIQEQNLNKQANASLNKSEILVTVKAEQGTSGKVKGTDTAAGVKVKELNVGRQ